MTALRFVEGEDAIFALPRNSKSAHRVGAVVTIKHVGPFLGGDERIQLRENLWLEFQSDYVITWADGGLGAVDDWQLRKLDDPGLDAPEAVAAELEEVR